VIIWLYGLLVLVTGIAAIFRGAWWPGAAGLIGPTLCWWAGSGIRGSFMVGTSGQKIGGLVAGAIFASVGLSLLYYSGYWVRLFSVELDGIAWGLLGLAIGFVFTPRSAAEA
jgi:hypothetical protein